MCWDVVELCRASVDSVIYVDHSAEAAEATAVFHQAEVRQSIDVQQWIASEPVEIYPGQYVWNWLFLLLMSLLWLSFRRYAAPSFIVVSFMKCNTTKPQKR